MQGNESGIRQGQKGSLNKGEQQTPKATGKKTVQPIDLRMGDETNKEENRFRSMMEELRGMRKKLEKMEEDKRATEKKLKELDTLKETIAKKGKRKERTEERGEEKKDTPKKRCIELPKIATSNIVVGDVRRFVEKAKEKIRGREDAKEIDVAITNALQNSTYNLYSEAKKEIKGDLTKEALEQILDKIMARIEREKAPLITMWDLEKEGQKEDETMYLWANRVRMVLSEKGIRTETQWVGTFVKGIRNRRVKEKMNENVRKREYTLDEIVAKAEGIESVQEGKEERKREETKTRTINPIVSFNFDRETCIRLVQAGRRAMEIGRTNNNRKYEGDGEEYYQEEDWEQEEEEENKEEGGDKGRGKEGRGEEGKATIAPITNNDGSVMIYATSNVVEEN